MAMPALVSSFSLAQQWHRGIARVVHSLPDSLSSIHCRHPLPPLSLWPALGMVRLDSLWAQWALNSVRSPDLHLQHCSIAPH